MPRAPEPDPPGIPELPAGLIGSASPHPGIAYRLLRPLFRLIASGLRFRVSVDGLERLPRDARGRRAGGWIAAGLPHRSWIDPFLLWALLPPEPRLVFFGDARTMARSPLRRWVVRRVGGILPIPSHGGAKTFEVHAAAAAGVLDRGAVFCLFPESGQPVPPDAARPIAAGIGYVVLRSGAPVVPVVIGGNHELYLGRRIVVHVGEPLTWRVLAGVEDDDGPTPGSHRERELAHAIAAGLHDRTARDVAAAFVETEPGPGVRKRWTGLTTLFR